MNTSLTFLSLKLDYPEIKTLERENLILMKKCRRSVQLVFNLCSTEQSCIHIGITCYKVSTLTVWCLLFCTKIARSLLPRNDNKVHAIIVQTTVSSSNQNHHLTHWVSGIAITLIFNANLMH